MRVLNCHESRIAHSVAAPLSATNIRSCFSRKRNLVQKKFIPYFFNLFFHVQSLPSHLYHQFWDILYVYTVFIVTFFFKLSQKLCYNKHCYKEHVYRHACYSALYLFFFYCDFLRRDREQSLRFSRIDYARSTCETK